MLLRAQQKCLVDLVHPTDLGHVDPRVAWDGEHHYGIVDRIDVYDHHNLGQDIREIEFLVVVAAQQQDIPYTPTDGAVRRNRGGKLRLFFSPLYRADHRGEGFLDVGLKVVVAVGSCSPTENEQHQHNDDDCSDQTAALIAFRFLG